MSLFINLPPIYRAMFALWSFILCNAYIFNIVLSTNKKRYVFAIITFVMLLPIYLSWQIIFDLSLGIQTDSINGLTKALVNINWIWWLIFFIVFTGAIVFLLINSINHEKNNITPNSIKTYLDNIMCGVCYYRDNGKILFSNIYMNDLCNKITGSPLLNGSNFNSLVANQIKIIDDKVYKFTSRNVILGNENLHEIIASDISIEYKKTEVLEIEKNKLSILNKELKNYYSTIDEVVRHEEILQTKINVHDEMNRLMLSTIAADRTDVDTLDNIFALWEQNALLLNSQAEDIKEEKEIEQLMNFAKAIKVQLKWENNIADLLDDNNRKLFFFAAYEAITNASKHGGAKEMVISFKESKDQIECSFINNGEIPSSPIVFSGGLLNLKRLFEKENASISYKIRERFVLTMIFSKKNSPNG